MTTINSLSHAALAVLCLGLLAACGGGEDDSVPAGAKVCQMKLYGVAIWGEVRPPSVLEKKTLSLGYETPHAGTGRIFFHPEFVIHSVEKEGVVIELLPPPYGALPPYAPEKLRIVVDAYEGYRYGKIWSCMVEELVIGDVVFIRSSGDETVSAQVRAEAYWPTSDLPNRQFQPQYEYFSLDGDSASLDLP